LKTAEPKLRPQRKRSYVAIISYVLKPKSQTALRLPLNGVHGAGEIGDEAIASRVEAPTAMRGDQAIER
jgi:hypothetical protein